MNAIKQLLRQPIKATAGILLVAIAVAVLCVCAGQSIAARETQERLNRSYLTLAFPKSDADGIQSQWLDSYAREHPEVVKEVSHIGLASAYIPELTIDNWAQHWHKPLVTTSNLFTPYDTAILEIILTDIGEVQEASQTYAKDENGVYILDENGVPIPIEFYGTSVTVQLTGKVERAIALEEGYPDPTGFTVHISLTMDTQRTLDALNLEVGGRYLVHGTNYVDTDWQLRHRASQLLTWNKDIELPEWDLHTFKWQNGGVEYNWTEEQKATLIYDNLYEGWIYTKDPLLFDPANAVEMYLGLDDTPTYAAQFYVDGFECKIGDLYHGMPLSDLKQFRSVTMICRRNSHLPNTSVYQTADGEWVCEVTDEISYVDQFGHTVIISRDEKAQLYRAPTIARLTGSAEDFLTSEEGTLWAEALHNVEVNNHAFAFLGVDNLGYIENFDRGEAQIIQGRDLTDEELKTGAKVCVISKQLAEANGLTVGDTIEPQFYDPDMGLKYQLSMSNNGFLPKPFYYFANTTQLREAQSYTIVGIYEQNDPTPSLLDGFGEMVNPYGFTSNTIFAPKESIEAAMYNRESWMYKTVVIHNGLLEEFQLAAIEAGLGEEFQYTDNGYSAVEGSLATYQENSARALTVGMTVYGILILLFLVLFPTRERAVLLTMEALGTKRPLRIGYLLTSSMGLLIPGTAIGAGCGMLLWDKVSAALSENEAAMLDIRMNVGNIGLVTGLQLVSALALVLVVSVHMTKNKNLSKRK